MASSQSGATPASPFTSTPPQPTTSAATASTSDSASEQVVPENLVPQPATSASAPGTPAENDSEANSLVDGHGASATSDTPTPETPPKPAASKLEITLPAGLQIQDQKAFDEFTGLLTEAAKEAGLTNEQASKLGSKLAGWEVQRGQQAESEAWDQMLQGAKNLNQEWQSTIKGDPELGGPKYTETMANARKGFRQFGGQEFADFLIELSGGLDLWKEGKVPDLTRHPAVVRLFHKLGAGLAEDSSAGAGAPAGGELSQKEKLAKIYNNPTSVQVRGQLEKARGG